MGALCVFVINVGIVISVATLANSVPSTGRPNQSFCINLTSGKKYYLPDSSTNVRWMKKPTRDAGRCRLQGVLKITPPRWSRCVYIHMAFERPYRYSFNLGDSWKNVAKGGDIWGITNDAELWGYYSTLNAYRNNKQRTTRIFSKYGAVKSAMLIELGSRSLYLTNYYGFTYGYKYDKGLFTYSNNDNVYLGLNRVIHNFKGSPYQGKTGRGLCSVCIYFQKYCEFKPPIEID